MAADTGIGAPREPVVDLSDPAFGRARMWAAMQHRDLVKRPHPATVYFHWPAVVHQENLVDTDLHRLLGRCSHRMLSALEQRLAPELDDAFTASRAMAPPTLEVDLLAHHRRLLLATHHRLLFGAAPSDEVLRRLDAAVDNVQGTIKGTCVRNRAARSWMLAYLESEIAKTGDAFRERLGLETIALPVLAQHVHGVFFATAGIQIPELVTHCVAEVAASPAIRGELTGLLASDDPTRLDLGLECLLEETLRKYPLFRAYNRVAARDVEIDGVRIEAGSAVQLVPARLREAWREPDLFCPRRWLPCDAGPDAPFRKATDGPLDVLPEERELHFPFGIGARACPARRFTFAFAKQLVSRVFRELEVELAPAHPHTRQLRRGLPARLRARGAAPPTEAFSDAFLRRFDPNDRGLSLGDPRSIVGNVLHDIRATRRIRAAYFAPLVTYAALWLDARERLPAWGWLP